MYDAQVLTISIYLYNIVYRYSYRKHFDSADFISSKFLWGAGDEALVLFGLVHLYTDRKINHRAGEITGRPVVGSPFDIL